MPATGPADVSTTGSSATFAHITHEAIDHIGGIGTVLAGMLTSPSYQAKVGRSILVGPFDATAEDGGLSALKAVDEVTYASHLGIDEANLGDKLNTIAWALETPLVLGKRFYDLPGENRTGEAEVLLIDVQGINLPRLNALKAELWEAFGLESARHEHLWDFDLWVRLAEPAFHALKALTEAEPLPCTVMAHEFMGVPTALKCSLDEGKHFRTFFHGHECATARDLVENHPGHDVRFYASLQHADAQGKSIETLFCNQDHQARHALVSRTHHLDGILAVGQDTANELARLTDAMQQAAPKIHVAHNGLPAFDVTPARKESCREQLQDYAQTLFGRRPDILITHVTRPVVSKAIWRDAALLAALNPLLEEAGLTACYFLLSSAAGVRPSEDVRRMEAAYGWPREHRRGWTDLVGPEVGLDHLMQAVNQSQSACDAVLLNQFGFTSDRIGDRVPAGMTMADFRIATDVELGMATYEPFGISPLEPLAAGAVCVVSSVCGCADLVRTLTKGKTAPNVLIADYIQPVQDQLGEQSLEQLLNLGQNERDAIEHHVHQQLAKDVLHAIPADAHGRAAMVERGQSLLAEMNWDKRFDQGIWPVVEPTLHAVQDAVPKAVQNAAQNQASKKSASAKAIIPGKAKPTAQACQNT